MNQNENNSALLDMWSAVFTMSYFLLKGNDTIGIFTFLLQLQFAWFSLFAPLVVLKQLSNNCVVAKLLSIRTRNTSHTSSTVTFQSHYLKNAGGFRLTHHDSKCLIGMLICFKVLTRFSTWSITKPLRALICHTVSQSCANSVFTTVL